MSGGDAREVALALIGAINRHEPDRIKQLITEDHVLVDPTGRAIRGRDAAVKAWAEYFQLMPDYNFRCDDAIEEDGTVLLAGAGSGTLASYGRRLKDEDHWELPTAWKAVVGDGMVRELHIYQDNKPVADIISRYSKVKT
jgi:hypothetical protein